MVFGNAQGGGGQKNAFLPPSSPSQKMNPFGNRSPFSAQSKPQPSTPASTQPFGPPKQGIFGGFQSKGNLFGNSPSQSDKKGFGQKEERKSIFGNPTGMNMKPKQSSM